jgi:hypothetical protein
VGIEIGVKCREGASSGRAGAFSDDADELSVEDGGWSDDRFPVNGDTEGASDDVVDRSGHEVRRSGDRWRIKRE